MKTNDASPLPASRCPDESVLQAFVNGELAAAEGDALADHLQRCPSCQSLRDDLRDGEEYGRVLREARGEMKPLQREELIAEALELIRRGMKGDGELVE